VQRTLRVLLCLFAASMTYAKAAGPGDSTTDTAVDAPSAVVSAGEAPASGNAEESAAILVTTERAVPLRARPQSWRWVHAGIALQLAGNLGDVATSWKQPEGNSWLCESRGQYAGTFYRSAAVKKSLVSVVLVAASYAIAIKWPKARRFVGAFNLAIGASFAAAAVNNLVQNPNFRQ
jgi:hypothetical protein